MPSLWAPTYCLSSHFLPFPVMRPSPSAPCSLFETSQSLFWASFGLVELDAFELVGLGSFTRFWAMLMFGSYSVINVIVLLNLLIAMMSNSYNMIHVSPPSAWVSAGRGTISTSLGGCCSPP